MSRRKRWKRRCIGIPRFWKQASSAHRILIYGEVPVAFVALRPGHLVREDELRAHAANLLADYKVPERILLIAETPKGLTGKVDRRRPRAILIAQSELGE
jgi:acyl-CoA synthetase (AMP-forming)/AMP-acid ligase II